MKEFRGIILKEGEVLHKMNISELCVCLKVKTQLLTPYFP